MDKIKETAKELRNTYNRERRAKASDEAREARNAYYRAWRAKNKDKVREYNERYWEKKAGQLLLLQEKPTNPQ